MSSQKYRCVLACEDIRQEVGGRISLIGVLGSKLYVQEFPFHFPKFCLFIEWGELIGTINVTLNIIPPSGATLPPIKPSATIQGQQGLIARSMIILNSFVFPKQGLYVFEFWSGDTLIGKEPFQIEKYEPPPKVTN